MVHFGSGKRESEDKCGLASQKKQMSSSSGRTGPKQGELATAAAAAAAAYLDKCVFTGCCCSAVAAARPDDAPWVIRRFWALPTTSTTVKKSTTVEKSTTVKKSTTVHCSGEKLSGNSGHWPPLSVWSTCLSAHILHYSNTTTVSIKGVSELKDC